MVRALKLTPAEVDEVWARWRSGQAVKVLARADAGEPIDGAGSAAPHRWDPAGAEASVGVAVVAGRAGGDLTRSGGRAVAAGDRRRSGAGAVDGEPRGARQRWPVGVSGSGRGPGGVVEGGAAEGDQARDLAGAGRAGGGQAASWTGHRSRSRAGSRSSSPMMGRCRSRTSRSTGRCSCRPVAACARSSPRTCGPGGRPAVRPGRGNPTAAACGRASSTSPNARPRPPTGRCPAIGRATWSSARMSPVATLVERSTRFVMLVALPEGHRADLVADALAAKITTLPAALTRTLTWDQGHEMAAHARFTDDTGIEVYFCDPKSPRRSAAWRMWATSSRIRAYSSSTSSRLRTFLRSLPAPTATPRTVEPERDQRA